MKRRELYLSALIRQILLRQRRLVGHNTATTKAEVHAHFFGPGLKVRGNWETLGWRMGKGRVVVCKTGKGGERLFSLFLRWRSQDFIVR